MVVELVLNFVVVVVFGFAAVVVVVFAAVAVIADEQQVDGEMGFYGFVVATEYLLRPVADFA